MNTQANNPSGIPDDLASHVVPNPAPHITDEPEAPFPTLPLIAMMLVFFIAAILNGSTVMLVSALLPTPLVLWRLFVTLDEWAVRRAAMKTPATATMNSAVNPATAVAPQPTTI